MGRCAVCGEFAVVGWGAKAMPLCQLHFEMKLKEVRKTIDKVTEVADPRPYGKDPKDYPEW